MGLIDWRNTRDSGPVGSFIVGLLLFCVGIFLTIRYFLYVFSGIYGVDIFVAVLLGFMLLFFFPFLVFGGFNEMREAICDIKSKNKKE